LALEPLPAACTPHLHFVSRPISSWPSFVPFARLWPEQGLTHEDKVADRPVILQVMSLYRSDPSAGATSSRHTDSAGDSGRIVAGAPKRQDGCMAGPLFSGLVVDELDRPVDVAMVGDEPFYVVDDDGFRRHIESRFVDRQVLEQMRAMIQGNEDLISEGTMKMLGQEDIFTKAMIERSLRNVDEQFDQLLGQGLPEEARAWLGMLGFRVVIDVHGNVVRVEQPSAPEEPPE
jgi:hypothetical protein